MLGGAPNHPPLRHDVHRMAIDNEEKACRWSAVDNMSVA